MNTVESTLVSGSELAGSSGAKKGEREKGERDPDRLSERVIRLYRVNPR